MSTSLKLGEYIFPWIYFIDTEFLSINAANLPTAEILLISHTDFFNFCVKAWFFYVRDLIFQSLSSSVKMMFSWLDY